MNKYLYILNNYCDILPHIIPDDIKYIILEMYLDEYVNKIIKQWFNNISTIKYNSHLRWIRSIYHPNYNNIYDIQLVRRQNAILVN